MASSSIAFACACAWGGLGTTFFDRRHHRSLLSLRSCFTRPAYPLTNNGVCCPASKQRWRFTAFCMADEKGESGAEASERAEADIETLEARLGLRRRAQMRGREGTREGYKDKFSSISKTKNWEAMTLLEKAWELYVGEKGALFWLNKLAYASIFAVIGGWIIFRFIGPALGLYQLDSPLLPPNQVFGGS